MTSEDPHPAPATGQAPAEALGFMGFWADIDADYELRYQEWHNCEHMPERVGIPGFIEGRRYRALLGSPRFFMCYVTDGPEVLGSPAYLAALNRPTPWTSESLTHFRNPVRSLYRNHCRVGRAGGYAPYILQRRFDHKADAATLAGMVRAVVAEDTSGTLSGGLYEVDEAISGIMTAERRIYSGGPGRQQYLFTIEALDRDQAEAAGRRLDALMAEGASEINPGLYWLENRIQSAELRRPVAAPVAAVADTRIPERLTP